MNIYLGFINSFTWINDRTIHLYIDFTLGIGNIDSLLFRSHITNQSMSQIRKVVARRNRQRVEFGQILTSVRTKCFILFSTLVSLSVNNSQSYSVPLALLTVKDQDTFGGTLDSGSFSLSLGIVNLPSWSSLVLMFNLQSDISI